VAKHQINIRLRCEITRTQYNNEHKAISQLRSIDPPPPPPPEETGVELELDATLELLLEEELELALLLELDALDELELLDAALTVKVAALLVSELSAINLN